MSAPEPLGPLIDALGVTAELTDNHVVTEVLVLAKVSDLSDGQTALGIYHSGMDWMSQLGLLAAAKLVIASSDFGPDDDD